MIAADPRGNLICPECGEVLQWALIIKRSKLLIHALKCLACGNVWDLNKEKVSPLPLPKENIK